MISGEAKLKLTSSGNFHVLPKFNAHRKNDARTNKILNTVRSLDLQTNQALTSLMKSISICNEKIF